MDRNILKPSSINVEEVADLIWRRQMGGDAERFAMEK